MSKKCWATSIASRDDAGQRLTVRDGDYVMVELRNRSATDAFVSVLDLSPDGSISQLYPRSRQAQDNKIAADGKWTRLPLPYVFQIGKPYGNEIFKAIATREPADFSALLQDKQTSQRGGSSNPLSKLLLSSNTSKRGADPLGQWATAETTFEIQPR